MWSVLDQALFAGANFVVNVLLARWLSPEAYGAYTVAFTVFLLFSTLHQGMLTEPMLVFGPGRFKDRLPAYFGTLLRGHLGVSAIGFAVLGAGALGTWAFGGPLALTVGLLAIAIAQGGILLTWLTRSMQYVTFEPQRSAVAGAIYAVLLLGGVAALYAAGVIGEVESTDVLLAVGVTGAAGLLSGLWLVRRGGLWPLPTPEAEVVREARAQHVEYGRWAVASGGLDWVAGYLPIMWLSLAGGLAEAGGLRALYNFALPAVHVFQVLGTLMVPTFVKALEGGTGRRTLGALTALAVVLAGIYGAVLLVAGAPALSLIYDGKFDAYADLMWAVALVPVGIGVVVVLLSCLRAMERPRQLFWARIVALVLTVAPLALLGGVTTARAALLTIVAISLASALAMGIDALRHLGTSGASGPDSASGDGPQSPPPASGDGAGHAHTPEATGEPRLPLHSASPIPPPEAEPWT
ncbi:oligosaccharide flippase family protein [Rubricoccus marinus]|uniref:Polysaccharide biosynthesis protein C-terminal domain-containing protein n=1 Tax=Rubricoccus marinus TaxID=716817 RepID=A0A259U078_9BACT|nr:oligosaccharide flippase family protein [Rubricoccus marinus]OZC03350.1 hypothetical protein BSZ36_10375 [Rubricoccus marinus]